MPYHFVNTHDMVAYDHSPHVVNCSEQQLFPFWKQFKEKDLCSFSLILLQLFPKWKQLPIFTGLEAEMSAFAGDRL